MNALTTPAALLAVPLLLWLATPGHGPVARRWGEWIAVPTAAVAVAVATALWLWPWHTVGGPYTSSDFSNYCASLAAWQSGVPHAELGDAGWHLTRSLASGWLPAVLAVKLGALRALAVTAGVGSALTLAGLYVWGRAIHSPVAGALAMSLAAALPSFVVLTHSVNFYPMLVAGLVWSAALAAVALRWPTTRGILFGSLGAGLAFLVDCRGLIWGLTASVLVAAAAMQGRSWHRVAVHWGLLVLVLVVSFEVGPWAYPPGSHPLESDVDARRLWWDLGYRDAQYAPPWVQERPYVWGRTPVTDIPGTLRFLWDQRTIAAPEGPPDVVVALPQAALLPARLAPWVNLSVGGLVVSALVLLPRPKRLLVLGGLAPFFASLLGARDTVEAHPRFVITGTIVVPLLLGVAAAGLTRALDRRLPTPLTRRTPRWTAVLRWAVALGVGWVLATGLVPSVVSPAHPTRVPFPAEDGWFNHYFGDSGAPSGIVREVEQCEALFAAERERGLTVDQSWLDASDLRQ